MRLGVKATIEDLLIKLDGVYGIVEPSQSLLSQFYSAKQEDDEDIARWACRLEDLLDHAQRTSRTRRMTPATTNEMLCQKFWSGLKPALYEASRHKYDTIKSFGDLVIALRRIELELRQRDPKSEVKQPVKTQSKAATTDTSGSKKDDLKELKEMVVSLSTTVKSMQQQMANPQQGSNKKQGGQGGKPKQPGNRNYWQNNQPPQQPQQQQGQQQGQPPQRPQQPQQQQQQNQQQQGSAPPRNNVCWRCGQEGHLRIGCRVNLNTQGSATPGQR